MGVNEIVERGVFLDRDGVINCNVFNSLTKEWESPHRPQDFKLFPWTIDSLRHLLEYKYKLFLVSNQPSYAKGKTSFENIRAVHARLHSILTDNQIVFTEYYYCYHHPEGIVPELAIHCECRKPGIYFLKEAEKKYSLDMSSSWIIGDRDSDIKCGQKSGVRTIRILDTEDTAAISSKPDFQVATLAEAVAIIIKEN